MIKAIIFDFDGTIADTVDIKTQAFAELYKPYGKDIEKSVVKYHLSYGGVSRFDKFKYFHKEFLNIELSESEIQDLAKKFSKLVTDKVVNAPYITGAFEFISKNYNEFDMFISTATPTNEITEILLRKKLQKYFLKVFGSPESKFEHVKKIISDSNYTLDETVFIGDSSLDKEAADQNDILFIEVCNEKKSKQEHLQINDFFPLKNILKSLGKGNKK